MAATEIDPTFELLITDATAAEATGRRAENHKFDEFLEFDGGSPAADLV